MNSFLLYSLAALGEIGGCFAFWAWLRLGKSVHFGAPRKGRSAEALLVIGEKAETTQTIRLVPTPVEYWVCTTFPRERVYRTYCFSRNPTRPPLDVYEELGQRFPTGLADVPPLPEEMSGAVTGATARG